jgi:hydroxymethylbilane synthase
VRGLLGRFLRVVRPLSETALPEKIVIATRESALARWQAEHVGGLLRAGHAGLEVELLPLKTRGDVLLDVPLAKAGGKGLFVREIEEALLSGRADLAVHSMKDMPAQLPRGLLLGAVPERETETDLFLSARFARLADLPPGARLGTGSLRRQAQVLAERSDLRITMLRGNVETRLRRLMRGEYDAIILASAGVKRLGLSAPFRECLAPPRFLPAIGQGALGLEMREDRRDMQRLVSVLDHEPSRLRLEAERAFLAGLNGGCQAPVAGHAVLDGEVLRLEGLVAEPDGSLVLRRSAEGPASRAAELGLRLAREMLDAGAGRILETLYGEGNA